MGGNDPQNGEGACRLMGIIAQIGGIRRVVEDYNSSTKACRWVDFGAASLLLREQAKNANPHAQRYKGRRRSSAAGDVMMSGAYIL